MNTQRTMNDTPTPRTDEWLAEEKRNPRISGLGNWLDYCKTLERELTAVTKQRDRLDDQLDEILLRLGRTQERMFDAERQRDRLTKAIEPLKYWRDISECDCSNLLPQGGCLRCDLDKILNPNQPTEP